ncbi:hypothetical protein PRIPAC_84363, partial [Pristionchus pacificus]|uniref:C-type lectin n=1 Tax=Pristionchus pacificus TaxID=54126 RepID=A0A2A6BS45_PRIPA
MNRLLFFFIILNLAHSSCPNGFELVRDGECRGRYTAVNSNWNDISRTAVTRCKEIQGKAVIIHNDEHQSYWRNRVPSETLFMGIVCNSSSMRWEWDDGSSVDYRPKEGYMEELDAEYKPGQSWDMHDNGYWHIAYGTDMEYSLSIFCTTQLQQPPDYGCDSFEDTEDGIFCQVCKIGKMRKTPAEIVDPLWPLFIIFRISRCWSRRLPRDGHFLWFGRVDERPVLLEACGGVRSESRPEARVHRRAVVRGASSTLLIIAISNQIYSPGYPYDASVPCDWFLTVPAGRRVRVQIMLLEANSCCDRLVLQDATLGGNIVAKCLFKFSKFSLTGEITDRVFTTSSSNLMRVSWQPQGGVNVRGAMFTFNAGSQFGWIDGSDWDYDHFYPGFPITGLGNCVAMNTTGTTGEWVNTDCTSKQAVACERTQHYSPPGCSAGPWNEGDIIYSPGIPTSASTPRDFILSVDTGKLLQVELFILEANTCCDRLVISENYICGTVLANLTGEVSDKTYTTSSSNFMRGSWQPNGGVNVRGFM